MVIELFWEATSTNTLVIFSRFQVCTTQFYVRKLLYNQIVYLPKVAGHWHYRTLFNTVTFLLSQPHSSLTINKYPLLEYLFYPHLPSFQTQFKNRHYIQQPHFPPALPEPLHWSVFLNYSHPSQFSPVFILYLSYLRNIIYSHGLMVSP